MKQVFLSGDGQPQVLDVPVPGALSDGVLVRNAYSLISTGTEGTALAGHSGLLGIAERAIKARDRLDKVIDMAKRQGIGPTWDLVREKLTEAVPLGYSTSGVVVEVRGLGLPFKEGDRLACMGAGYASHADYISVPKNLCAVIPNDVSLDHASFAALACIALQGIRRLDLTPGENVGVVGLGLIGQLTIRLLCALGYHAFGLDLARPRIQKALEVQGVNAFDPADSQVVDIVRTLTNGYGLDGVIVCAASKSNGPVNQAFELCRSGGRVSMVGSVGLDLSRSKMYDKELELRLSCSYGPGRYDDQYEVRGIDYPIRYARWTEHRNLGLFLRLLADKRLDISSLVSHKFTIDQASKAYDQVSRKDANTYGILFDYKLPNAANLSIARSERTILRKSSNAQQSGRVRLGIIGVGSYARGMLLPQVKELVSDFELVGVASRSGATATTVAEKYDARIVTSNYRELLECKDIDAVIVATRHAGHAALILDALDAGKHVFVEKPMTTTVEDGERVLDKVQESGLVLRVGFNRRFSPFHGCLKSVLGTSGPRVLTIRVAAGDIAGHWSTTSEEGGRLVGEGVHFIDLSNWMFDAEPTTVMASTVGDPEPSNTNFAIVLSYDGGGCAQILYTSLGSSRMGKEYFEVFAPGQSATCRDYAELETYPKRRRPARLKKGDKGQKAMLQEFAMAIRQERGEISGADAAAGLAATRIALNCYKSVRVGPSSLPRL